MLKSPKKSPVSEKKPVKKAGAAKTPGKNARQGKSAGKNGAKAEAGNPPPVLEPVLEADFDEDADDNLDDSLDVADDPALLDDDSLVEGGLLLDENGIPIPEETDPAESGLVLRPSTAPERVRDGLNAYLREINKFPMLKPEEELELARRARDSNDPEAVFRLVSSHLRLVVRIAMDFQRRWMQNVLDLIQEGNVGLVRAVSKFDPEKGIKFSYYATFWIKAYILKFIMDNWRLVKIGTTQTQRKLFYNLNKERQRLLAQGFDPDAATLAKNLNVSEDQIIEMEQRLDSSDMSLDAPMGGSDDVGGATRMDYLPALGPGIEDSLANKELSHLVRDRLDSLRPGLSEKELFILDNRLLSDEPVTLREIGEHFSITRERVRQIEARLLQKVRDHLFKNIKNFAQDWIAE